MRRFLGLICLFFLLGQGVGLGALKTQVERTDFLLSSALPGSSVKFLHNIDNDHFELNAESEFSLQAFIEPLTEKRDVVYERKTLAMPKPVMSQVLGYENRLFFDLSSNDLEVMKLPQFQVLWESEDVEVEIAVEFASRAEEEEKDEDNEVENTEIEDEKKKPLVIKVSSVTHNDKGLESSLNLDLTNIELVKKKPAILGST